MTPQPTRSLTAWKTAGSLRGVLRELFNLSLSQGEALERDDFDRLEELVEQKAALMPLLDAAIRAGASHGWKLHDSSTYPADESCRRLLSESAELGRRLQAHEKYILGQVVARKNQIGDRLDALMMKRQAAAGYRVPQHRGSTLDTSR